MKQREELSPFDENTVDRLIFDNGNNESTYIVDKEQGYIRPVER